MAETGQRGYIVTGREDYLLPYDQAMREIDGRHAHRRSAHARPATVSPEELQALAACVLKLDELARSIELQRIGTKRDEAIARGALNEGKSVAMDAIRRNDRRARDSSSSATSSASWEGARRQQATLRSTISV
jgi:CHASE3 domain sensor protein